MKFSHALHRLNNALASGLQVMLTTVFGVLVLVVLWGVASRYLLGDQASWSEELARIMMVWLALLGAALVAREDRHLGLDVVVRSWPKEVQRVGQLVVYVLIFGFAGWIMLWGGAELVGQRFDSGQKLPALGISKAWFYLALPVSGFLTSLFMIESFLTAFRGKGPSIEEQGEEPIS